MHTIIFIKLQNSVLSCYFSLILIACASHKIRIFKARQHSGTSDSVATSWFCLGYSLCVDFMCVFSPCLHGIPQGSPVFSLYPKSYHERGWRVGLDSAHQGLLIKGAFPTHAGALGISSGSTTSMTRIKYILKMNEWTRAMITVGN